MALTDKQKDCIIFYMGWPAKTLVTDSTHYSKIISDRLNDLSAETEKRVKTMLDKLQAIDDQLDEARCRLTATQVEKVKMDARLEIEELKKERRRCSIELGQFVDIPFMKKTSMGGGNVCV